MVMVLSLAESGSCARNKVDARSTSRALGMYCAPKLAQYHVLPTGTTAKNGTMNHVLPSGTIANNRIEVSEYNGENAIPYDRYSLAWGEAALAAC